MKNTHKLRPLTDVVIVKYDVPHFERETAEFVLKNTTVPYHLSTYDNYPDDKNLSVAWNDLIRRSDADYIALVNSDTQVPKFWLKQLLDVLKDNKEVGAVGPITNLCGTHQSGFKGPSKNTWAKCQTLSGFCLVFKKSVWEEVGGFDEEYELYGEDTDFCEKIKQAGYDLAVHYGVYVYHHGHKSMENLTETEQKDIEAIRKRSVKRFREKWPKAKV